MRTKRVWLGLVLCGAVWQPLGGTGFEMEITRRRLGTVKVRPSGEALTLVVTHRKFRDAGPAGPYDESDTEYEIRNHAGKVLYWENLNMMFSEKNMGEWGSEIQGISTIARPDGRDLIVVLKDVYPAAPAPPHYKFFAFGQDGKLDVFRSEITIGRILCANKQLSDEDILVPGRCKLDDSQTIRFTLWVECMSVILPFRIDEERMKLIFQPQTLYEVIAERDVESYRQNIKEDPFLTLYPSTVPAVSLEKQTYEGASVSVTVPASLVPAGGRKIKLTESTNIRFLGAVPSIKMGYDDDVSGIDEWKSWVYVEINGERGWIWHPEAWRLGLPRAG